MRRTVVFFLSTLFLFSLGCAGKEAHYTHDPKTDFSALKTFGWMPEKEQGEEGAIKPETLKLIKTVVRMHLREKGYLLKTQNPDFLVAAQLTPKKESQVVFDFGYNYEETVDDPGIMRAKRHQYDQDMLVLTFVNPASDKPVFSGAEKCEIKDNQTLEEKEELIDRAASLILKRFPPK